MAGRESGAQRSSLDVSKIMEHIERRVEERHAGLMEVPERTISRTPEVQVDRRSQQLADKLADALNKGVKALDRW